MVWLSKKARDQTFLDFLKNVKVRYPGSQGQSSEISGTTVKRYAESSPQSSGDRQRQQWAQREYAKLKTDFRAKHPLTAEEIQQHVKSAPKEGVPLKELAEKLHTTPEQLLTELLKSELMATGEIHFDASTASLVDWSHKSQSERGEYHKTHVAKLVQAKILLMHLDTSS